MEWSIRVSHVSHVHGDVRGLRRAIGWSESI